METDRPSAKIGWCVALRLCRRVTLTENKPLGSAPVYSPQTIYQQPYGQYETRVRVSTLFFALFGLFL